MFGDILSVISDTTIAATKGVGAEKKDKFRMNLLIALPAALVAAILDVNVYIVLIGGTFFAGIVGILTNGMTPLTFIQSLSTGTRNCSNYHNSAWLDADRRGKESCIEEEMSMNNMKKIRELSEQYALRQIELRRQIHTHPELGGQEFETGALIENELRSMGVEVRRGYAKTGLVGLIHGKKGSGNTILIRADMDALPMVDLLDCPYRSQNDGIAHTCGHDAHTATLLGAAYILSHLQDEFFGTVKFCFQPAEEASDGGAEAMVHDGVLQDPKVDFAIGMHVSSAKPVGYVAIEPGPITAYPDFFSITFRGKGGHGSCPSKANDPILPLVATYQMIQNIQKRISPLEPAVIQVCSLQAGTAEAVIPDEAKAIGTVRTLHAHNREKIRTELKRIVEAVSDIYQVKGELNYRGRCCPVYNNEEMVHKVRNSVRNIFEKGFYTDETMKIGGEDFCFISKEVPSVFMIVGSSNGMPETEYPVHNPHFDVDEHVMQKGAEAFSAIAIDYLNGCYESKRDVCGEQ